LWEVADLSCIPSKEEMQRTLEARHGKELQAKFTERKAGSIHVFPKDKKLDKAS
jgi:hypothetical protein